MVGGIPRRARSWSSMTLPPSSSSWARWSVVGGKVVVVAARTVQVERRGVGSPARALGASHVKVTL